MRSASGARAHNAKKVERSGAPRQGSSYLVVRTDAGRTAGRRITLDAKKLFRFTGGNPSVVGEAFRPGLPSPKDLHEARDEDSRSNLVARPEARLRHVSKPATRLLGATYPFRDECEASRTESQHCDAGGDPGITSH